MKQTQLLDICASLTEANKITIEGNYPTVESMYKHLLGQAFEISRYTDMKSFIGDASSHFQIIDGDVVSVDSELSEFAIYTSEGEVHFVAYDSDTKELVFK